MMDQRGERRDSLLLAVATASVLLAGHPETTLHAAILASCFALSKLLAGPAGRRLPLLGAWALAAGIGAGLAAPVALPAAEYLPRSQRAALLEARHERLRASNETGDTAEATAEDAGRRHDPLPRLLPTFPPN